MGQGNSGKILLAGVGEPLFQPLEAALAQRNVRTERVTLVELSQRADLAGVDALLLNSSAARVASPPALKRYLDAGAFVVVLTRDASPVERLRQVVSGSVIRVSPSEGPEGVATQLLELVRPQEDVTNTATVRPPPDLLPKEVAEEMSGAEGGRESELPELDADLLESVKPSDLPPGVESPAGPVPPPAPVPEPDRSIDPPPPPSGASSAKRPPAKTGSPSAAAEPVPKAAEPETAESEQAEADPPTAGAGAPREGDEDGLPPAIEPETDEDGLPPAITSDEGPAATASGAHEGGLPASLSRDATPEERESREAWVPKSTPSRPAPPVVAEAPPAVLSEAPPKTPRRWPLVATGLAAVLGLGVLVVWLGTSGGEPVDAAGGAAPEARPEPARPEPASPAPARPDTPARESEVATAEPETPAAVEGGEEVGEGAAEPEAPAAVEERPEPSETETAGAPAVPAGAGPEATIEAARAAGEERDPRVSDRRVLEARRLLADGSVPEAAAALDEALRLDPDNPRTYAWMGRLQLERGEPVLAERWLALAVERRPGRAEYRTWLGDALKAKGDREGARRAWRRVLREEPDNRAVRERLLAD